MLLLLAIFVTLLRSWTTGKQGMEDGNASRRTETTRKKLVIRIRENDIKVDNKELVWECVLKEREIHRCV
jgi:hypothetical protein